MELSLKVVVPLALGESEWKNLVQRLEPIAGKVDVVLASSESEPEDFVDRDGLAWMECPEEGRAKQMNYAASRSEQTHLWFVHADSCPEPAACERLLEELDRLPDALHYFRLSFYDGGGIMKLNEWGANLRSSWFRAPFGDQALCLSRELFIELGGYDTNCSYGEDHLLVRKARKRGVRLNGIDHSMPTSARKYVRNGWLKVVLDHQVKWIAQALRDR